jgi:hypothetical protein
MDCLWSEDIRAATPNSCEAHAEAGKLSGQKAGCPLSIFAPPIVTRRRILLRIRSKSF